MAIVLTVLHAYDPIKSDLCLLELQSDKKGKIYLCLLACLNYMYVCIYVLNCNEFSLIKIKITTHLR